MTSGTEHAPFAASVAKPSGPCLSGARNRVAILHGVDG
jgi:hypothetical protein